MTKFLIGAAWGWAGAVAVTYFRTGAFDLTGKPALIGAAVGAGTALVGSALASTLVASATGALAAELAR